MRTQPSAQAYACIIVLFTTNPLFAAVAPHVAQLQQQAIAAELHQNRVWKQLLHYSESSRTPNGIESQVDDARFFLSADGKINPQAELLASIDSLFRETDTPITNEHPRCRFVSREQWLRDKLDLPPSAVPAECQLYTEWRSAVGSHSMSLVFPASYLNSPSSMFGHTLLRLDPENIDESSEWLSWSLNFAAETGDENFSAGYAFKGIAGGYAGKFSSVPYFKKLQEYGAIENRDIWEYQLDFTPDELSKMLDHAWELRDIQFDYYFFRQNCSYRLLELMDYARPGLRLTDQFRVTTIPADTVKAVVAAGLVEKTHYRPSLGTGINTRYQALPKASQRWIKLITDDPSAANQPAFEQLPLPAKAQIVRIANDLLTYRSRRAERSPEVAQKRLSLLHLISKLPVEQDEIARPDAPEKAHDTRTLSLARGRVDQADYTDAGIRWSYHDVLDNSSGYLRGAGIELGSLHFRRFDSGDAMIQSLGLVNLQSISDRALIFNALSWNLSVGFDRNPKRLGNRMFGRMAGSIGKSTEIVTNNIGYALLGASMAQYSQLEHNFVDANLRFGVLNYHRNAVLQFEIKLNSVQDSALQTTALLNYNLPLAKNHAIRFTYQRSYTHKHDDTFASVQYRFYF